MILVWVLSLLLMENQHDYVGSPSSSMMAIVERMTGKSSALVNYRVPRMYGLIWDDGK